MITRTTAASPDSNGRFENPGIVSVNDRGARGDNLAGKIAFVCTVIGVLLVGGVYGFNQWRARVKAGAAEATAASKSENKPAQIGLKRTFEPAAAASSASPPAPAVLPESGCRDTVLEVSPRSSIGASGPLRVDCNGKLVTTADPKTATQVPPMPPGMPQGTQSAKVVSRFGGDVLQAGTSTSGQASQSGPIAQGNLAAQILGTPARAASAAAQSSEALVGTAPATQQATTVSNQQGNIGTLLTSTRTPKVTASRIGDRNMLLAKGAQIDCALTTKLVNEVSGFASCVLTRNVYSDNGKVVLLDRGSEALGEYVATVQQGQRRLFVLWQRVKTPGGVVIGLDSPAADGLGTMGLDGYVDNRWWDRLGAAFLLSFVKDAIAYQIANSSSGTNSTVGGVAYENTARTGEQMAEKVLASTINIKPTIYKNQGDRASIYVARDLDFSTVYALRAN